MSRKSFVLGMLAAILLFVGVPIYVYSATTITGGASSGLTNASVGTADASSVPLTVDVSSGQTANLQEWSIDGTPVASVSAAGVGDFTSLNIGGSPFPAIIDDQTFANEPATCSPGDEFWPTDNRSLEGKCVAANTWRYRYKGFRATLPPTTGWSGVNTDNNCGSCVIETSKGVRHVDFAKLSAVNLAVDCRTPPSAPYTIKIGVEYDMSGSVLLSGNGGDTAVGIAFKQSGATGNVVALYNLKVSAADAQGFVKVQKWSDVDTASTDYALYGPANIVADWNQAMPKFWAIRNDNAGNILFYNSIDGDKWHQFDTRTIADFLTAADEICLAAYVNGNAVDVTVFDYVEQTGAP